MAEDDTSAASAETPSEPMQVVPPIELVTAPETPPSEPVEVPQPETPTAQIPASEPLPPEPEPIAPTPAPEPPQAASASVTTAPITTGNSRDMFVKARAVIQDRKHKKLDKIMETLNATGKITNDEVEKLLHVSDATATRYLSALEKDGKIKQVGKTGMGVAYTKV